MGSVATKKKLSLKRKHLRNKAEDKWYSTYVDNWIKRDLWEQANGNEKVQWTLRR